MSTATNLFPLLWVLAFLSPIGAIVVAGWFYALHSRRRPGPGRRFPLLAYVLVLLVGAVIAFPIGAGLGIEGACSGAHAGNLCGLFGVFVTGPFASSLAICCIAGLVLLLPADDEEITPAAATPFPVKTRWYARLWHGEYSLAYAFWLYFILGTVAGMILSMNPAFLFVPVVALVFQPLFLGYQITAGIGVWRSADALVAASAGAGSIMHVASMKAIAARSVVILLVGLHLLLLLRSVALLVLYLHR